MRYSRWIGLACCWLLAGSMALGQEPLPAIQAPWAVMTGKSVIDVRAGLRYVYQRLGRKDLVAALDSAAVTNLVSGNLKGLDLTKPLGCVVMPNASGVGSLLTFVPMTDTDAFRGFLSRHGLTISKDAQGNEQVTVPLLGTVALRFDQKYAWFAFNAVELAGPLPNVTTLVPASHREVLLAASIYLERIPADQRQVWQTRAEQGMRWLSSGAPQEKGQLTEVLGLPMAGLLLHRLAQDARELTLLAQVDTRTDRLWAKALVTPRPEAAWMQKLQTQPPQRYDVPATWWAKLRGKSDDVAAKSAAIAFQHEGEDKLILTMTGGSQLELKAELSGAMLAYHTALTNEGQGEQKRPTRRERRRLGK